MNYPPAHTLPVIATFGLSFGVSTCARLRSPWLLDLNTARGSLIQNRGSRSRSTPSSLESLSMKDISQLVAPLGGFLAPLSELQTLEEQLGHSSFLLIIPAPVIPHQAPAAFPGISPQLGRAGNPARAANLLLAFVDPLLPLSCCSRAPGDTEE